MKLFSIRYFFIVLLLKGSMCLGQVAAATAIKEIRYDNLQLKGDLPYQEVFNIKGHRNIFLNGKADAGILTIKGITKTRDSIITQYFWWAKNENEDDFEFYINQGLLYGVHYKLVFQFYQKKNNLTELKSKLKSKFASIAKKMEKMSLEQGNADIQSNFNSLIKNAVEESIGNHTTGMLTISDGKVEFTELSIPGSYDDAYNLLNVGVTNISIDEYKKELKGLMTEIASSSLNDNDITRISKLMNGKQKYFDADDIAEIRKINVSKPIPFSESLQRKIKTLTSGAKEVEKLQNLSIYLNGYKTKNDLLNAETKEVEDEKKNFNDMIEAQVDQVYAMVGSGIEVGAKVEKININAVVGTRFTAIAGASIVDLNPLRNNEVQPISYFAVKYHLRDVDKRVPDPFLQPGSILTRLSVIGGWKMSGDLTYQGRPLSNVIGINPIVGFSCDLNNYISLDLFCIFYKYQSVNPFDTNPTLGFAPGIGLSADFDLINRLKSLFGNNKPYSVQTPISK